MDKPLHIWVTGASRGIGYAITQTLSVTHVVSASARDITSLQRMENVTPVVCDVTNAESVEAAHRVLVEQHGDVDVLINNAGIGIFKEVVNLSVAEFDACVQTNLRGVFLCSKAVLPAMISRASGMIVDVNSVASRKAFSGNAAYAATKAGALALGSALREEVRQHGIKVVEVLVGATTTNIWPEKSRNAHAHRMMEPLDVASVVSNLIDLFSTHRLQVEEITIRPQLGDL